MSVPQQEEDDELEWEEWDGKVPFWHHCVAGSLAGVAEHTLLYPIDTVKTHLQCTACPHRSSTNLHKSSTTAATKNLYTTARTTTSAPTTMMSTMRHLMSQAMVQENSSSIAGASRLWRGVQTMAVGCIPAHALYFSAYESVKLYVLQHHYSNLGMAAAGAAATFGHDVVMTPLDTIKQRLQLGHYHGMVDAFRSIIRSEGTVGLYRSFPITLITNIPYGMVMVSTNEFLKKKLSKGQHNKLSTSTCLLSSSVAGMVAAATTTPLDRIKTFLQTQQLQPACDVGKCPKLSGPPLSFYQALRIIYDRESYRGFLRGLGPRVVTHTPAVAISWTTYETAKQWLASM